LVVERLHACGAMARLIDYSPIDDCPLAKTAGFFVPGENL
jgi:hypothetical protein